MPEEKPNVVLTICQDLHKPSVAQQRRRTINRLAWAIATCAEAVIFAWGMTGTEPSINAARGMAVIMILGLITAVLSSDRR
jgi:hypothetical protein